MTLIAHDHQKAVVDLARWEFVTLGNGLNESREAVLPSDYPARVGKDFAVSRRMNEAMLDLLRQMDGASPKRPSRFLFRVIRFNRNRVSLELSLKDIEVLTAALSVTLEEIEEWEFQTRTGVEIAQARALRDEMAALSDKMKGKPAK